MSKYILDKIYQKHWAIFVANNVDKTQFIKSIFNKNNPPELSYLHQLKGELFSESILIDYIKEEQRFGNSPLNSYKSRDLSTFSGGEQKKILLQHCLAQKPDFIVLDSPFDNLDAASQDELQILLDEISDKLIIIQLYQRSAEKLKFINKNAFLNTKGSFELAAESNSNQNHERSISSVLELPTLLQKNIKKSGCLVSFRSVNVNYNDKPILKNINWQINVGEFWQLIGPNGAGKSTLLSLIIGDNPKAYGQNITLFGMQKGSGESVADLKKNIGYFSPSMVSMFTRKTSVEHMVISGIFDSIGLYKIPSERHVRIANEWLATIGLKEFAKKEFFKLSIGQQRLIMIARAMVKQPPLLILDEPMAGLDDDNALKVNQLINKIHEAGATTILYVSHRKEPGLLAKSFFELKPSAHGSQGTVLVD
jgi:molybdate transport system ATP-binding protein